MKECKNCNIKYEDEIVFCPICGQRLSEVAVREPVPQPHQKSGGSKAAAIFLAVVIIVAVISVGALFINGNDYDTGLPKLHTIEAAYVAPIPLFISALGLGLIFRSAKMSAAGMFLWTLAVIIVLAAAVIFGYRMYDMISQYDDAHRRLYWTYVLGLRY